MTGYIYKLICPIKKAPIYVGSTMQPTQIRLSQHKSGINNLCAPLYSYLHKNKIIPRLEIIDTIKFSSIYKLKKEEQKWIDFISKDHVLLNVKKAKWRKGSIKTEKKTRLIRVDASTFNKVMAIVSVNKQSIGGFFTLAAEEKIKTA